MKVDTIQTSFVGGEFAPALFGRTDIATYQNALALCENFLIRPFGSVISAPGTEFINECKTGGSTSIAKIIPFVFSKTDAYIIEMGVGYFRFFTDGAVVVSPGTTPYEIAHTYTASEIPNIHFAQLNDIITIDHPNHPPAKLTRLSATSWTLGDAPIIGGPFMPDNLTDTTIQASTSVSGATVSLTVLPTSVSLFVSSGATVGHVGSFWKIGSTTTNATTGLAVQGYAKITSVVNGHAATGTVMSLLSTTAATTSWAEGSWSGYRGYPARITFHQQRQFHARTASEPQTVWGSKSFSYNDYAVDGGADDDALNLQLSSTESNDIKWIAPGRDLVVGTYGGEFKIATGDSSPLTPSNVNVTKQTSWGSEAVIPKKIGNFFYYIQRFGKKLRELFYTWDLDNYKSVDRTILSPHISGTGGFIDMAYQQNPDTVLWCVCSDGTLATMTREVDQDVSGWTRLTTDGVYESIASIPSQDGPHDEIWVVVKRTINGVTKRYIERFVSQEVPDRQDQCFYVHSGLTYDAYSATSAPTATNISISTIESGGYDAYTKLLIHFNGTDAATAYTAETGQTVTFGATAQLDTSIKYFGSAALQLQGALSHEDYVTIPDSEDWNFGTGDFTIDFWTYYAGAPGVAVADCSLISQRQDSNNYWQFGFAGAAPQGFYLRNVVSGSTTNIISVDYTPTIGNWYHVELDRSGNNFYIFVNGALVRQTTLSVTMPSLSGTLNIGFIGTGLTAWKGSFDEVRISKGIARNTISFTPPTSAYLQTGTAYLVTTSAAYFSANDVGQRLRSIDADGNIQGEMNITAYTSSTVIVGDVKYGFTATSFSSGYWGVSVSQLSGLNHLEAKTVTVCADGGTDKPNKVVSNGTIALAYDYFVVNVGLPYTQKLKTLPQEAGAKSGTAQGKIQRINQIGLKVNRSYKGFYIGGSEDLLDQVSYADSVSSSTIFIGTIPNVDFVLTRVLFRDPTTLLGSPELLYTGTIPNITFRDDYRYGAQVYLENSDPLPIELLSLMTTIDTNEG